MCKEEVMAKIQDYTYNMERLQEIREQIKSIVYKTTATYGNLAPSAGSGFSSKVEDMGNRRHMLRQKECIYERKVQEITRMIEHSGLTEREKELMWWVARCGKLQAYARQEKIGKFNVYKIRDRAVEKIIAAQIQQNVVK